MTAPVAQEVVPGGTAATAATATQPIPAPVEPHAPVGATVPAHAAHAQVAPALAAQPVSAPTGPHAPVGAAVPAQAAHTKVAPALVAQPVTGPHGAARAGWRGCARSRGAHPGCARARGAAGSGPHGAARQANSMPEAPANAAPAILALVPVPCS